MPSRDYQLGSFAYEPRVLSIAGWYVNLQYEEPLVSEHQDLADAARQEIEQMEAVLASRQAGLHQLVWWRRVERVTCTCGLVLRSVERFLEPLGHLDQQAWRPATEVVVHLPYDEAPYLAACQLCGEQQRDENLPPAHVWAAAHVCRSTE